MRTSQQARIRVQLLLVAGAIAVILTAVGSDRAWLATPAGSAVKLAAAGVIGWLVTAMQRQTRGDRTMTTSMQQAQVLLAVAGALMMLIIGDSLARAFGLAGAAAVIRFRTAVEDPRDVTVLFLLMGLGMACGLGALPLAGLGAAFLAACLVLLTRMEQVPDRCMKVALVANGPFPGRHVEEVFARNRITLEPLELTNGDAPVVRYRARLSRTQSLEDVTTQLMNGGTTGITSVTWEALKKGS